MANEFSRNLKDATHVLTKAYPAAGAANNTGTIDLGSVPPAFQAEHIEIEISTPALSAHTDSTKNLTYTLQDSADDSIYANLSDSLSGKADITFSIPGVASTGSIANKTRLRLPSNVRRYVQIKQAVDSGGPTITGSSSTTSVLF